MPGWEAFEPSAQHRLGSHASAVEIPGHAHAANAVSVRQRVGVGIRAHGAISHAVGAVDANGGGSITSGGVVIDGVVAAAAAADKRRDVIERDLLDKGSSVPSEIPPFENEDETGDERRSPR